MSSADNNHTTGPVVPGESNGAERAAAAESEPQARLPLPLPWASRDLFAGQDAPEALADAPEHPREIFVGEAGVHLLLSRLLSWGVPAHAAGPGLPYDAIADAGRDVGLIRLQVKTTACERRRYQFAMRRGFYRSVRGIFDYRAGDYDVAAFASLWLGRLQFRAFPVRSFGASREIFLTAGAERHSWAAALAALRRQRAMPPDDDGDWPPIPPLI